MSRLTRGHEADKSETEELPKKSMESMEKMHSAPSSSLPCMVSCVHWIMIYSVMMRTISEDSRTTIALEGGGGGDVDGDQLTDKLSTLPAHLPNEGHLDLATLRLEALKASQE